MFTHEEMIGLQAEKHDLISTHNFQTREEYVLYLMHSFAYNQVSLLVKDQTILDLGCNTGYGSEILSKTAKRVIGVDVSEKAVLAAKKQYAHLDIDFQLIDGIRLPFNDNEFDIIISCQVIEHIVDYNIYLNEIKRVLSTSGVVIFTTPNAHIRLDPGMKPWYEFHVHEFIHSELQALLETHFEAVDVMGLFAEKPLYLIEKNRTSMLREAARAIEGTQHYSYYQQLRAIIKRMIPTYILNKLRKQLTSNSQFNKKIDSAFIEQHGLNDFFYRTDNLDESLDLLAICTNKESTIKEIKKRIKKV